MLKTRVTELLGIDYPIIQGGLAHLAYAELAAAVSNAGGLGQISAATLGSPDRLRHEIEKARRLTTKPFAVNFAIGRRPMEPFLDVALEEGVPVISITGGNPEPLIRHAEGASVKKLVLVGSTRTARKAEEVGANAVIAVGFEGGGHLGRDDTTTLVLVPRVVDTVKIPVLASGAISDSRGFAAVLALGAEGIEMGTRFVATKECVAHGNYKNALVEARETDTTIIERSLGRPGRALKNAASGAIIKAEAEGATIEQLLPLIGGEANVRGAIEGNLDEGFVWASQAVGLIDDVPTVAELIDRLVTGTSHIIKSLARYA